MRSIISGLWIILICFETFQVNAQHFITMWQFGDAATELNFYAVTDVAPFNDFMDRKSRENDPESHKIFVFL